jgi:hypothetical protein
MCDAASQRFRDVSAGAMSLLPMSLVENLIHDSRNGAL